MYFALVIFIFAKIWKKCEFDEKNSVNNFDNLRDNAINVS